MRFVLFLFLIGPLFCLDEAATVVRVIDGDTLVTSIGTVRLLYVDTPESHANAHGPALPAGLCATAFLTSLVPATTAVTISSPGDKQLRDRYGRLLAVVWLQLPDIAAPISLNASLIAAGWSPYWKKYGLAKGTLHDELQRAHDAAREQAFGAWTMSPSYMDEKSHETTAPRR